MWSNMQSLVLTPEKNWNSTSNKEYYLPLQSVIKSDCVRTKYRKVFGGSCKPSNVYTLNCVRAVY